jgi:hypothetical protein
VAVQTPKRERFVCFIRSTSYSGLARAAARGVAPESVQVQSQRRKRGDNSVGCSGPVRGQGHRARGPVPDAPQSKESPPGLSFWYAQSTRAERPCARPDAPSALQRGRPRCGRYSPSDKRGCSSAGTAPAGHVSGTKRPRSNRRSRPHSGQFHAVVSTRGPRCTAAVGGTVTKAD